MEVGLRQGQPQTGGTPGTTRTEDITGFNLSTDTESDLSLISTTGPEAKHHLRKVSDPVGVSQSSSKRNLERTMKTFNHPVALRMESGGLDP